MTMARIDGLLLGIFDIASVLCYNMFVRQERPMPGKEVGHDTDTSLVVPMGIPRWGLSGNVTRS